MHIGRSRPRCPCCSISSHARTHYKRCDHRKEICDQANYRHIVYGEWGFDRKMHLGKGLNVLFSGLPGTGKTMGAEVIAHELWLDLYKIDLSQVVCKYTAETEKN